MSEFIELRCDTCGVVVAYIDGDYNAAVVCPNCYYDTTQQEINEENNNK